MRIRCLLILAAFLLLSCASSEPAPVQVIGAAEDLTPLTGEWVGTYENRATGGSGSISFHLTDDPKGAHGDVVFMPRTDVVVTDGQLRPQISSGATVLDIEFVRVAQGEITGRMTPYPDPDDATATLETHFAGHLAGNRIEGTFVTYSNQGVAPRRGTWKVHRK